MTGSRWLHSEGYVIVYMPNHPLASRHGCVFEHRLVIHEAGWEVPEGHHVHHKNGVKDDNRLENLAVVTPLWHSRHHLANRPDLVDEDIVAMLLAGKTYAELVAIGVPRNRVSRVKRDNGFARHGAQTHCKRGHEFTPENTHIGTRGRRNCRACRRYRDAVEEGRT